MESIMAMVNSSGKSRIYLFKGFFFNFNSLLAAQQKHLKILIYF